MLDTKWTSSEKAIARRIFDAALAAELGELIADFKRRAEAAATPADIWEIEEYLRSKRLEIDEKYDYRYSQLPLVFGRLIREGRISESELAGLGEGKLSLIRRIAGL